MTRVPPLCIRSRSWTRRLPDSVVARRVRRANGSSSDGRSNVIASAMWVISRIGNQGTGKIVVGGSGQAALELQGHPVALGRPPAGAHPGRFKGAPDVGLPVDEDPRGQQ